MLAQLTAGALSKSSPSTNAKFRCWPIDWDVYLHMNNACYFRVAELARWRQSTQAGMFGVAIQKRWMFIVVEQNIRYCKPILPFQSYVVRSEMRVLDGKFTEYQHYFQANERADAQVFAQITMRCVVKHASGKTVTPAEVIETCPSILRWLAAPKV